MKYRLKHISPISRAHLSIFILIFAAIGGIAIWRSLAATNPNLPGDLNNDNTVNITDLSILLSNYGTSNSTADINGDGTVNVLDLSILLSHYGSSISGVPTVNLTASPQSITSGESSTITWSATNSSNCKASGGWSGDKSTGGGSESTGPLSATTTFILACSGPGGDATDSATVTVTSTAPACTGITVATTDDLQTLVINNPSGSSFCIKAGVHRITAPISLRNNDIFVGEDGAILSGAVDITSQFTASGSFWAASNQTENAQDSVYTCVDTTNNPCRFDNDVYFDDKPLQRVLGTGGLGAGKFFFDYANHKIYIGSNPSGHKVEVGVAPQIIKGYGTGVDGVTVNNLIIEKAANPAQTGAIQGRDTWTFQNLEVRDNHGIGLQDGGMVLDNYIHDNGESGYGGSDKGEFAHNEVAFNNYAGYSPGWEGGATKWPFSIGVYVHDNYVHDNIGNGIWFDGSYYSNRIENNRIINNTYHGILYEISYSAVIANNDVEGSGSAFNGVDSTFAGAGIMLTDSRDVEVYGNTVINNRDGISLQQIARSDAGNCPGCIYGYLDIENDYVHDNTVAFNYPGGTTGLVEYDGLSSYYTSKNNRFAGNKYTIGCTAKPFIWTSSALPGGDFLTWTQWQSAGEDTAGTFTSSC